MDGGGKWRESNYIAFCGYIDVVERFDLFRERWRSVLTATGIEALHYAEAMAWQGEWASLYGKWGTDRDARRLEALLTFADAIVGSTMEPVAFCGDSNEIRQKALDAKRPDLVMLEMAVVSATQALPPDDSISLLLDWEEGFDELCCRLFRKMRAERVINSDRIILLGFGDDKAYAELQAADMLACCHVRNWNDETRIRATRSIRYTRD
jgi:hypothetical protein